MQTIETLGAIRLMHRVTTKAGQKAKNHYLLATIAIKLLYMQISYTQHQSYSEANSEDTTPVSYFEMRQERDFPF